MYILMPASHVRQGRSFITKIQQNMRRNTNYEVLVLIGVDLTGILGGRMVGLTIKVLL